MPGIARAQPGLVSTCHRDRLTGSRGKLPPNPEQQISFRALPELRFDLLNQLPAAPVHIVLRVEQHGQAKDPWGNVRAAFTAKTSIDRKDFGLTWNQLLESGGVMVGDRVEIEAEIEAVKQVAAQVA